jgi:AraC-like DNA-binding protein
LPFTFSIFDVLILIGVTQGFVIAGLIWSNKKRSTSKLLLSFLLVVFNLLCIKILLHTTGLWQQPALRYLPLAVELAISPLIWLYVLSLVITGFKLRRKYLLHFSPFVISLAYSLFIYISVLPEEDLVSKDALANSFHFNTVKNVEDYLTIFTAVFYWVAGLKLVIQYRQWLFNNIATTDAHTYVWLRNVAVLMGVLILGLAIAMVLDYFLDFGTQHFLHWQLFFIYLALLIYYLGFKGYQLPDKKKMIILYPEENQAGADMPLILPVDPMAMISPSKDKEKGLKLSNEKIGEIRAAVLAAFEVSEVYLDQELSLQKLARSINIAPAIVSAVINSCFQKSFRNLVNDYRVEKVKDRLRGPGVTQLSLLGIAYECGFNSEASFYRIFKNAAGVSPRAYLKQVRQPE